MIAHPFKKHGQAYDQDWHQTLGEATSRSAALILSHMNDIFSPASLVEVGCGHGHWIAEAIKLGIDDVLGIDGPWTDVSRLLVSKDRFVTADLGQALMLDRTFDLALCTEVAEHLPFDRANCLVDNICNLSEAIMFGAAIPLQGGYAHINEQWPSFWISKFDARDYKAFDIVRPKFWSNQSIHCWYRQNTLVFVRRSNSGLISRLTDIQGQLLSEVGPLDIVHPEKWMPVANYDQFSIRKVSTRLPGAIARSVLHKLRLQ